MIGTKRECIFVALAPAAIGLMRDIGQYVRVIVEQAGDAAHLSEPFPALNSSHSRIHAITGWRKNLSKAFTAMQSPPNGFCAAGTSRGRYDLGPTRFGLCRFCETMAARLEQVRQR